MEVLALWLLRRWGSSFGGTWGQDSQCEPGRGESPGGISE